MCAVIVALVVRSRDPIERHVVLCCDDLVDLAIGFLIVQVVNFLVRLIPEVSLTHHVSRKTSHSRFCSIAMGRGIEADPAGYLKATFVSTSRISGEFAITDMNSPLQRNSYSLPEPTSLERQSAR